MPLPRRLPSPGQAITALVLALAAFAYPALGEWLIARFGVRAVAAGLLAFAALHFGARLVLERRALRLALQSAGAFALLALAAATGERFYLQLFPVLVNATLAVLFAATLATESSMIERGARAMQPYLPAFTRPYCRAVTAMWVAFFAASAIGIAVVVARAPELWRAASTTYYFAAVAAISLVEFGFRKLWFRNYARGPLDRALASLFPAEATARGRRSLAYVRRMHELGFGPGGPREGEPPPDLGPLDAA